MSSDPTPSTDLWTVRRVLEWTTGYLADHGSESPRLEAEILLAHARNCPRIALYTHIDDELSEEVRSTMRSLVQRRARHEPVAYLVGHREFFSLNFEVTPDVFIPRPETETLVMETLSAAKDRAQPRILELCTGSGCIPIAVAVHAPRASVTAVERSEAALEVARRNARRHDVSDRITFLSGDLFQPIESQATFDVIVSNPPYIATTDTSSVEADVHLHEPDEALFAGEDGLDVIRRIITDAPQHLVPGGTLLIEFSPEQADAIVSLIEQSGEFADVTILPDLSRLSRIVKTRRYS